MSNVSPVRVGGQAAYDNHVVRIGRRGIKLNLAQDVLDPEQGQIVRNLRNRFGGPLETRLGQDKVGDMGPGQVNQLVRVDDPARNIWTRLFAVGARLWGGQTQAAGLTDLTAMLSQSLSGRRCTLLPSRVALTGDPWTVVADDNFMAKVRWNGGGWDLAELGVTPPTTLNSGIGDLLTTSIAAFDPSDNTEASTWIGTGGRTLVTEDNEEPADIGTAPTIEDVPLGLSGPCVKVTFKPGSASGPYYSMVARPKEMDLTKLQGGVWPASDEDYIRLLVKVHDPAWLSELRVYFVCSAGFDPAVVPGTDVDLNTDAFVKSIKPHDFTNYTELLEDAVTAAARSEKNQETQTNLQTPIRPPLPPQLREREGSEDSMEPGVTRDPRTGQYIEPVKDPAGPQTQTNQQLKPGRGTWTEIGRLGRPQRRREFMRIGTTPGRGWDTITGIFIVGVTNAAKDVAVEMDDWFLTGGFGPDVGEPDATPYDYVCTHYDTRTGAESNPSPVQPDDKRLSPQRQRIALITYPYSGYGAGAHRQRYYRRGGFLADDWYFVGESTSNGGEVVDTFNDTEAKAAGTVLQDNWKPIQTITPSGAWVREDVPVLFGPVDGLIYACGDQYRPGTVYWSKPDNVDAWPVENQTDACGPTERLMTGLVYGDSAYVFSRAMLYALRNNADGTVIAQPTTCTDGAVSRNGACSTPRGMAFVALDGVRLTNGGPSTVLSADIDTLFRNQVVGSGANAYYPIDFTQPEAIFLEVWDSLLFFVYVEQTTGRDRCLVYDLLIDCWFEYAFCAPPTALHTERTGGVLLMGDRQGSAWLHQGLTDGGEPIGQMVQTGAWDMGLPRIDKQMGDLVIDADLPPEATVTVSVWLTNEQIHNGAMAVAPPPGRRRYTFDPFGIVPQRGRNITQRLEWATETAGARLFLSTVSYIPEPEQTITRVTPWEAFEGTAYLMGCLITADTGGQDRTVVVEGTIGTTISTLAALTVNHNGRRAVYYSWPVGKVEQVRLRPSDDGDYWLFYGVTWIKQDEPPTIAVWDSNEEIKGDTYYTGLDIVCDTFGQTKTLEIFADGQLIATRTVATPGKRFVHFTFGSGRAHIYRFKAIDSNPGRLYTWEWMLQAEPGEQTNWNQNYSVAGTLTDKYLKGVLLECDTFGQTKAVEVQVDQVTVETLSVTQLGRGVQHFSFPEHKGRVFRLWPVDPNPGRLYGPAQWIFDEEPLGLVWWETQELDHGLPAWFMPLEAHVTIRCMADVTLVVMLSNQIGDILSSEVYTIPATGPLKVKRYVPFVAAKGALVKYTFTSSTAFWLYKEESHVLVQPLGGSQPAGVKPFGNDDLDRVRGMANAELVAARSGGGAS